jgi:AcrR family transcriptional regulator
VTGTRSDALKNRGRLLAEARRMMRAGDLTPSFNELARRTGVGVGTVYRHFPDYPALLAGLVEDRLAELEAVTARARAEADPVKALETLLRGTVALELDSPEIAQMLASPQPESRVLARQLDVLKTTADTILTRGRKAKSLRADVRAADIHHLVCGLDVAIRAADDPEQAAKRYVDIVMAGLRNRG